MKIAYVVNEDITKNCGVVQKIHSQTKVWKKHGHRVRVFSLSSRGTTPLLDDGVVVGKKIPRWGLRKFFGYFEKTKQLKKQLYDYMPDVIYMRYVIYFPGMLSILKNTAPFIFEINSNDLNEFEQRFRKYQIYNALTRGILLGNADGFVSVSHELKDDISFSKYKRQTIVIGNGIDAQAVNKKASNSVELASPLQAVFIGSDNNQFWHGLDKIVYLARNLSDVVFHIIGPTLEDMMNVDSGIKYMTNIHVYGYLDEKKAQLIVAKCDVGISTLSLYRKGMEEASPLKSRQYLAQGIPVIVGYKDTDLFDIDQPFILNIGNYEENIKDNFDAIKEFILNSRAFKVDEIQSFAKNHLDCERKELKRLDFFKRVLNQHEV